MPIKKQLIANNRVCKVTFTLPRGIEAETVHVVGEFNGWDEQATPMTRLKNGTWKAEVRLQPGQEIQFRYLINGSQWENDPAADRYVPNPFGSENSVIIT